jgi:hypothetical protein
VNGRKAFASELIMKATNPGRRLVLTLAALLVCGQALLFGQALKESPVELVRETVNNENKTSSNSAKFMFLDQKQMPHGSQTKLIVETNQATAGMLVAVNDKPLSAEQRQAEEARLNELANNPEELKKKQKAEREDGRRTARIVKALPDAFLFEFDGTEPGKLGLGKPGDELVRLKFRPNPSYAPPSHAEQVLTGMQGYVLIDANLHRIAKIDGTLFKDVGFGWGILGRLDKGGRFLVEQGCFDDDHWEPTRMDLSFTGKELLFKAINIKSSERMSNFRQVAANLSFAQGVQLLKKQSTELAQNHTEKDAEKLDPK